MPHYPRFRITGPLTCPVAQRAALALTVRGKAFPWTHGARTRLVVEQRPGLVQALESAGAILELIEDLHPDQPLHPAEPALRARHRQLIATADMAQRQLALVLAARNLRDLDIAVFALRPSLLGIEAELRDLAPDPLRESNLDLVLAPLLWRVALLDRCHAQHLGDALPCAAARLAWLLRRPLLRRVLSLAAGRAFLDELAISGGVIAARAGHEDWDRCFDPAPARTRVTPIWASGRPGLRAQPSR